MNIEKVFNGYIADSTGTKRVFVTIDELLGYLLLTFEGKCEYFGGESYGKVIIKTSLEQPE